MDENLLCFAVFSAVVWLVVALYLLVCTYLLCTMCKRMKKSEEEMESSGTEVGDVL